MFQHDCYISLGSNLGDRLQYLQNAIAAISRLPDTTVKAISNVYETDPVGYIDQPQFLNAVIGARTNLAPRQVMASLLTIEQSLGRKRTFRNGPRTIDLDLLLFDDFVIDVRPQLIVPHPRMHERAFVLLPLYDVAKALLHPVFQTPVAKLYEQVSGKEGVRCCLTHLQNVCEPIES